jgi:hypothetical protein
VANSDADRTGDATVQPAANDFTYRRADRDGPKPDRLADDISEPGSYGHR